MATLPSLSDIATARTDSRQLGDGTSYALDFNVNGQSYTFVPENVVKNGGVSNDANTYYLPWFADMANQKDFAKNAAEFDLSGNSGLASYLTGQGNSPKGYLIPSDKVAFDSSVQTTPTGSLGGSLTGLKQVGDQLVYGVSGGHGNRYFDASNNQVHDPYTEKSSWLGDVFGGVGQDVADFVNSDLGKAAMLVGGAYAGGAFDPSAGAAGAGAGAGGAGTAELAPAATQGALGSGTFATPGDLGTSFVTQGGLNPAATVGQITDASLANASLSPGAIAGTGAAGAGLLGAATSPAGSILPAAGGAAAGTAAAGMTAAEAAGAAAAADSAAMGIGPGSTGGAASNLSNMLVPGAIAGSALIGANAAKSAADTQAAATDRANQIALDIYKQQKELQAPYREAGITAQNRLMELLGLGGNTTAAGYGSANKPFTYSDLTASPDYQFRLGEGLKALDRQAAMRGGLISGGAVKAAQTYGQDQASQEYQNAFNRYQTNRTNMLQPLGNLITSGQNAAANTGTAAANYGTTAGSNITSGAAAQAAGTVGATNALTGGVNQYLNYSTNNNLLDILNRQRQTTG